MNQKKIIYVDNNATTAIDPEVLDEMMPFLTSNYGNPSSMHSFGGNVAKKIQWAREKVAELLGASDPQEIIFTSCGTESDNMAIKGILSAYPAKKRIISTRVEHPAVKNTVEYFRQRGCETIQLGVNHEGMIDLNEYISALDSNTTALVSIMYANNETGVIFPVEECARLAKVKGIPFHCDAVQAVGKILLDMKKSAIDLLAISGHKIHAPKGVGALYIRKGTKLVPFMIGGHQEYGKRGGTENIASIVGLGKAAELALKHIDEENIKVKYLRDKLESELLNKCLDPKVNGKGSPRLPNTTNISFEYIEGEAILLLLDQIGICASSGSACTSGSLEPSHVLRAMGVPFTAVHGSVRFSLSRYNTESEIDFIIEHLPKVVKRLRDISPYGRTTT